MNEPFSVRLKKDLKRNRLKYLMVLPVVIWFAIFVYWPMYGVIIAFQRYEPSLGILGSKWVGFQNFTDFFGDVYFFRLLRNTLTISLLSILFGFPAPIILAVLMNEIKNKYFIKTTQTLTYLPHFISLVVVCGMIKSFLGTNGVITKIIYYFTGNDASLLSKASAFPFIYVLSTIWQEAGWGSIIYIAALSGIDMQLYEACTVDGGGRIRQFIHITLPGIAPTVIIMLIMRMGSILGVGHEKIILLYNPSIYETSDVILSYVYRKGLLESDFSYSTAINLFNSVVGIVFVVTANLISRKVSETSLW